MRVSRSQPVAEQKQEDRARRERFVQNAVANVRLEGLEPSPRALRIWQRYIEGHGSASGRIFNPSNLVWMSANL